MLLLDEIEKAHPDVFNMLLQIMEEGRLTDSFGRHVDFRNVVMIMTSNIGSELIKSGGPDFGLRPKGKGTTEERTYDKIKETVMKELERYVRPEFIGRLDDVIVFRPLGKPQLEHIVEFELKKVTKRLTDHGLKIELTEEAKAFLIEKGTSADFGARPLRRAIEQNVEDPLSEDILRGSFKDKDLIRISVKTEEDGKTKHLYFDASKEAAAEGPTARSWPRPAATRPDRRVRSEVNGNARADRPGRFRSAFRFPSSLPVHRDDNLARIVHVHPAAGAHGFELVLPRVEVNRRPDEHVDVVRLDRPERPPVHPQFDRVAVGVHLDRPVGRRPGRVPPVGHVHHRPARPSSPGRSRRRPCGSCRRT